MAISIPDLEQRAALGWRAPEEERVGDWLLRAAAGFTGRANSALAVGDPGRPLRQAADAVCHWYQARGLPAMIVIPYPAAGPQADPVDRFLAGRGWGVRSGTATVMTAPAGQIARTAGPVPPVPVALDPEPDEARLALYHYRGQPGLPPVARQVLTSAPWQAFASLRAAGQTIDIGRVAAAGGWAGLTAIEVAPGTGAAGWPPASRPPSPPAPPRTAPGICTFRWKTTTRPPARCTSASASPRITATTTASPRRARAAVRSVPYDRGVLDCRRAAGVALPVLRRSPDQLRPMMGWTDTVPLTVWL